MHASAAGKCLGVWMNAHKQPNYSMSVSSFQTIEACKHHAISFVCSYVHHSRQGHFLEVSVSLYAPTEPHVSYLMSEAGSLPDMLQRSW